MRRRSLFRIPGNTLALLGLAIGLAPAGGFAESGATGNGPPPIPQAPEMTITWREIADAVDRHPLVEAGRYRVAAAEAGLETARAAPNPELEAEAAYGAAREGDASTVEWGISLAFPLGWTATRRSRTDAAEARTRTVDAENAARRAEILLELNTLFWHLVHEQARVAGLEALVKETAALAQVVAARVENGEARPVEAVRVEVELETLKGELEAARRHLDASSRQLGVWLGRDGRGGLRVSADLSSLPAPVPIEQARKKAIDVHPVMTAARSKVVTRAAELAAEKRSRAPAFGVSAFTESELDRRAYGAGLNLELPLWNRRQGPIRHQEATMAAEREHLVAKRLSLEAAVIEAHGACVAGVTLAGRYQTRILPAAESVVKTSERAYHLGETTLLDVIDARRTLLNTRREALSVQVRAQTDCSRLNAAIGEPL